MDSTACPGFGGFKWVWHERLWHRGKHSVLLYHSDPHFLRVPCWKITLFVIVPVLGPLVALIICYNWLHRRLAGAMSGQQTGPLGGGGGSSGRPEREKSGTKVLDPRAENLFALSTLTIRILRKTEDHLLRCTGPLMEKKGCLRRWGGGSHWSPIDSFLFVYRTVS